jgi:tripartite-type tricarboxylate transporter receptor subunit TctC
MFLPPTPLFFVERFTMKKMLRSLTAIAVSLTAIVSMAQEFPIKGKPIRVVVAFPPGIGVDAQARAVTPKLSEILGVPVVIDNKPGAGTIIASQEVIKAVPDGHTIYYSASTTMAQNPHTLKAATYDPIKDFTPISLGARGPLVLVVNADLGVKNVAELVAYGKKNPGKLNYGSFGIGSSAHIFGQIFASQTGMTDMVHVPYKGGSDMAQDLLGGRLLVAFDAAPAAIQNAKSGKVRLIGVASPERNPFIPEVPTLTEQGLKNLDITSFLGWYGPANMNPAVVKKLNDALKVSLAQDSVKEFFKTGAYTADWSTPQDLGKLGADALAKWGLLVQQAGIEKQ